MILFTKEKHYLPYVEQASVKYSVPKALILGHIKQESGFNPNAKRDEYNTKGVVWDSSIGLMQLLLGTAKTLDPNATVEKLYNPAYNIDIGTRLIANNLKRYNGNVIDSIAAYNGGSARKDAQGRYVNSKGVPNVQEYVDRVSRNYADYTKWLEHGANTIDVSINPFLVAGFVAVVLITVAGGVYAGTKYRKRRTYRLAAQ